MRAQRFSVTLSLLMLLAACGTDSDLRAVSQAGRTLANLFSQAETPDLRASLTPETIAGLGQPVLFVELPERGAQAGALLVQQDGARQTWATQDGITLTLVNGLLTQTRGIGGDLMTTDLADAPRALDGGADTALRIHRYLTGDDRIDAVAFVCTYAGRPDVPVTTIAGTFRTRQVIETCTGQELSFENRYWFDAARVAVKSVQWVGPHVGYAQIEPAPVQ